MFVECHRNVYSERLLLSVWHRPDVLCLPMNGV